MLIPDFSGSLDDRMDELEKILHDRNDLIIVGSSFGGLMATLFAQQNENRVARMILLAPALNFPGFQWQADRKLYIPVHLYIGRHDTVCPPDIVLPLAEKVFADLRIHLSEDDHFLRSAFPRIPWQELFSG